MRGAPIRNLAIVAAVLLVGGLALGFLPYSANGGPCGSALVASSDPFEADLEATAFDAADIAAAAESGSNQDACAESRTPRRAASLSLAALGALGLAGAAIGRKRALEGSGRHAAVG